jgi:hypothetical protein
VVLGRYGPVIRLLLGYIYIFSYLPSEMDRIGTISQAVDKKVLGVLGPTRDLVQNGLGGSGMSSFTGPKMSFMAHQAMQQQQRFNRP